MFTFRGKRFFYTAGSPLRRLLIGIVLIHTIPCQADSPSYRFERISTIDGLSQNTVQAIHQDQRGYLWFGTQDGLNQYDGYAFKVYKNRPDDPQSLSDDNILCVTDGPGDKLWVGTRNGLNLLDPATRTVSRFLVEDDNNSLNHAVIISLYFDRRLNKLWIGTGGGGLNVLDCRNMEFTHHQASYPTYSSDLTGRVDSLLKRKKTLSSILQVGDDRHIERSFALSEASEVLVVCVGEGILQRVWDTGNIQGPGFDWHMELEKSLHAGGALKNRIQMDLISLPPGRYTVTYQSDDSHSYNNWNDTKPNLENWWGIQILPLTNQEASALRNSIAPHIENAISNDIIYTIYPSPFDSTRLWIGTWDGLNCYNTREGTFKHYLTGEDALEWNRLRAVQTVIEDSSGICWLGTNGNGLIRLDKGSEEYEQFLIDPADPESHTYNDVRILFKDPSGFIWVGTDGGGLHLFDPEQGHFQSYKNIPHDPASLGSNYIRSITRDKTGLLWVGSWDGGVTKVNSYQTVFKTYKSDPQDANSLSHNRVLGFHEDKAGMIWIGTDGGGLNRFNPESGTFKRYIRERGHAGSLSNNYITSITEAPSGHLWLGSWDGGLIRFDPISERFRTFRHQPDDPDSPGYNTISSVLMDSTGVLWIGTYGNGLDRFDMTSQTWQHFRHKPVEPNTISNNFIISIMEDRFNPGIFWVGTLNGLNRMEYPSGTFTSYRHEPSEPNSISNNNISVLYQDSRGDLWIGTYGGGLNRYIDSTGQFEHFSMKQGLSSNHIYGILEDDHDRLWISSDNGLSCYDQRMGDNYLFKNFYIQDGLQGNSFSRNACYKTSDGHLYFGGVNGFNIFKPTRVKQVEHEPDIVISDFRILNDTNTSSRIAPSYCDEVELSYNQNMFTIEFSALDYTAPERNRYTYMLEGFDNNWSFSDGTRHFATYTNLDNGDYTFRVIGSNADGSWNNEGADLKIHIQPPFWGTWWFRLIILIVFGIMAVAFYWDQERNIRMKTELQAAHDAQMSIMPHDDPVLEGYDISGICIPANEVGGDFFDFFWFNRSKERFGIVVGDVSGKAMESAMTAVLTSGMIFVKSGELSSPEEILTAVNRSLFLKTDRKSFTALCLAELDIKNRIFTFSNAGLNEPVLKRAGKVEFICGEGDKFPLGTFENTLYKQKSIALQSEDTLLLYSDGLTEARKAHNHFFGYDAIKQLLSSIETETMSAAQIKDRIIQIIQKFSGSTPQFDDITLIVIKVL